MPETRTPALPAAALAALATVLGLLLTACGPDATPQGSDRRLEVVAGFYPLYEAARLVGGDRVEVENLTAAGAEPHDLELTTRQVDLVEDADVVLYLGGGFQPALEDAARRSSARPVDLLEGADLLGGDPHVWLDPVRFRGLVDGVRDALAEADPGGAATYEAAASAFARELDALHRDYGARLGPCRSRLLVTSHGAFRYLAERYGLEARPIAGLSPDDEPDPAELAELAETARAGGVTTVFSETLASPGIAETLAREAGARTAVLDPLEGLSDRRQQAGEGYVSVMRANLETLAAGLGCP